MLKILAFNSTLVDGITKHLYYMHVKCLPNSKTKK
jgi:hypothetical protein